MAESPVADTAAGAPMQPEGNGPRLRPVSNFSYLTATNLAAKVFSFVFVLYATRALGPSLWGDYTVVLSFVGLFGVLTDLGMGTLAVRDVSQNRGLATRYISNLLMLRVLLSALAILLIVVLAQFYVAPSLRHSVYVYAAALIPLAASNTLQLAFQFSERMSYSAVLNVGTTAATALLSMLAIWAGHHVLGVMLVFALVNLGNTLVMAWLVYSRFLPPRLEVDPAWWPWLVRQSLPFVVLTVLNVIYYRVDTQLLYILSGCGHTTGNQGCSSVGYYGIANRLPDILTMVFVGSLNAATLPAFNRVVAESREALARLTRSASTITLAFGVPAALFGTFFAPEALHILGGRQYMDAAPALAMLVWTFPFFLTLGALYNALYALRRQTVVTSAFAVTLVFNVVANLILIPRYSYTACAAITVASEAVNAVIVVAVLRRSLGGLGLGVAAVKVGAVAAVTALVLFVLHPLTIFVALPVGVVATVVGLRLTRVLGATETEVLGRMPIIGRFAGLVGRAA